MGPMVEELQAIQRYAHSIPNIDERVKMVNDQVGELGLTTLIGKSFWVSSRDVFGRHQDSNPKKYIRFDHGLTFTGIMDIPTYFHETSIAFDSLLLHFRKPSSPFVAGEDSERFREFILRVPVLAVQYMDFEDASV